MMDIKQTAARAKAASIYLAAAKGEVKNRALAEIAKALEVNADRIVEANRRDIAQAERDKLAGPLLKRLRFDAEKIADVCRGIQSLIDLPDPVGRTLSATELDAGLELYKVSCPIGVIGDLRTRWMHWCRSRRCASRCKRCAARGAARRPTRTESG